MLILCIYLIVIVCNAILFTGFVADTNHKPSRKFYAKRALWSPLWPIWVLEALWKFGKFLVRSFKEIKRISKEG